MKNYSLNKLFAAKPPVTDSHELLRQIEAKDAKFRFTQAAFFAFFAVALIILLTTSYHLQNDNQKLLQTTAQGQVYESKIITQLQKSAAQRTAQIQDLQNHIDCIVELFQQPNRASLTITNLQDCKISTSSSGGATGSTKSGLSNQTPTTNNNVGTTPATSPPTQSTPQPTPQPQSKAKGLVCKITLGLLCL